MEEDKQYHPLLLLNFREILCVVWSVIKTFDSDKQLKVKEILNKEVEHYDNISHLARCNRLLYCLNDFSKLNNDIMNNKIDIIDAFIFQYQPFISHDVMKIKFKKFLLEWGINIHNNNISYLTVVLYSNYY